MVQELLPERDVAALWLAAPSRPVVVAPVDHARSAWPVCDPVELGALLPGDPGRGNRLLDLAALASGVERHLVKMAVGESVLLESVGGRLLPVRKHDYQAGV